MLCSIERSDGLYFLYTYLGWKLHLFVCYGHVFILIKADFVTTLLDQIDMDLPAETIFPGTVFFCMFANHFPFADL